MLATGVLQEAHLPRQLHLGAEGGVGGPGGSQGSGADEHENGDDALQVENVHCKWMENA